MVYKADGRDGWLQGGNFAFVDLCLHLFVRPPIERIGADTTRRAYLDALLLVNKPHQLRAVHLAIVELEREVVWLTEIFLVGDWLGESFAWQTNDIVATLTTLAELLDRY